MAVFMSKKIIIEKISFSAKNKLLKSKYSCEIMIHSFQFKVRFGSTSKFSSIFNEKFDGEKK